MIMTIFQAKRLICNGHAPVWPHTRQVPGFMAELPITQISLLGFLLLASIGIRVGIRYK
jgi:hypothetical protein